jgi:hypothetical protein
VKSSGIKGRFGPAGRNRGGAEPGSAGPLELDGLLSSQPPSISTLYSSVTNHSEREHALQSEATLIIAALPAIKSLATDPEVTASAGHVAPKRTRILELRTGVMIGRPSQELRMRTATPYDAG